MPDESDVSPKQAADAEPADDLVTTRHSVTADGAELGYTVTAGRVVLRAESQADDVFEGTRAQAEVFMTAYTLDANGSADPARLRHDADPARLRHDADPARLRHDADPARLRHDADPARLRHDADPARLRHDADPALRPVTFAFNGGPGSSSVWLHLGLLGPRRVLMGDAGALLPPPYGLAENPQTLLRHSDLVFIDPVSTGFSRAAKGAKPKDFHSFGGDIESVGEVIRLWVTRNGRWMSPKYLCGESYGTTRAAGLAKHLQARYGMYLNGLILISPFLDGQSAEFGGGNDEPYLAYLPTYAAIANYHGKHGDRPLADLVAEAREYAAGEYRRVLALGSRLGAAERAAAVGRVAWLTGLSEDYVDRVNLRPEHIRFLTELMRDKRRTVGRLDGRFLGWDSDYGQEKWTTDPSIDAIIGPYTAALNHYVRAELGYASDLPYEALTDRVHPWSFHEFEAKHVYVLDKLAEAMRVNPHLRVHVDCGYYDAATPYAAAEHDLAHLAIPAELAGNIEFAYYEAGHLTYMHEPSRIDQSARLAAFVSPNGDRR